LAANGANLEGESKRPILLTSSPIGNRCKAQRLADIRQGLKVGGPGILHTSRRRAPKSIGLGQDIDGAHEVVIVSGDKN